MVRRKFKNMMTGRGLSKTHTKTSIFVIFFCTVYLAKLRVTYMRNNYEQSSFYKFFLKEFKKNHPECRGCGGRMYKYNSRCKRCGKINNRYKELARAIVLRQWSLLYTVFFEINFHPTLNCQQSLIFLCIPLHILFTYKASHHIITPSD